ncbi:peptide chain release factor N(5)-glutamine methyltransferase [Campylobacter sp. RM16192]|uniref:peptide chain release factor N(5)-glutamine methyltransferase n=1 Tax=Campylobacter sp. RM16192 TaxID=1660080 RepID=UPI001451D184|nr:peptide chain release factor N(5)-glutamine methyltransferase [Campylobacter sp. RM16192]QCD52369.1 protein-(glutamine-N5) methyltransferase [Campylobacter sp. RM16192]
MTIDEALQEATFTLVGVCENPARVAKILLMHHLNVNIEWVFLNLKKELEKKSEYFDLISRFKSYEPLEYITGVSSFYGLEFNTRKGVLIPRPETEILVDKSLEILKKFKKSKVCEIGAGSGIISICLALKTDAIITATDINEKALQLAYENAVKFGVADRIEFVCCSYMDSVLGEFDMIVSNPPYIKNSYNLDKFVLNEPKEALFGGDIGDEILKNIILIAKKRKIKFIACEMGYDQKASLSDTLNLSGYEAKFYQDLAGFDRGFVARLKL